MEILELNNTGTKMKNLLEGFNNRYDLSKQNQWIWRWMETAYSEKERKKLMKKNREPQRKVEYYY